MADSVDCVLGCALPNATGVCGKSGCEIAGCSTGFADCNGQPEDGCEADLDSDPKHCSLCINACDTGTCHDGSCQNVQVVASTSGDGRSVTDFAVDSSGVYCALGNLPALPSDATTPGTKVSLQVVPQAGGTPVVLADVTGFSATLALGDQQIGLMVEESAQATLEEPDAGADGGDAGAGPTIVLPHRLLGVPKVGGDATLLSSGEERASVPWALGSYVHWLAGGLTVLPGPGDAGTLVNYRTDQALYRVPFTGGTIETLASWTSPDLVTLLGAGGTLLVFRKDTTVDVADAGLGVAAGGLHRFEPESRSQSQILTEFPWARPLLLQDGQVYWVGPDGVLESVSVEGGAPTALYQPGAQLQPYVVPSVQEVAVDDRFLFLTIILNRAPDGANFWGILRVDRATGKEALLVNRRSASILHLRADGDYLYWLEQGQVLRAPKDG